MSSVIATPVPLSKNLSWTLGSTWLEVLAIMGATGPLFPAQVQDVQVRIADVDEVLLDLSLTDCISIPDADAPYALLRIDPARQAAFEAAAYRYAARVVDAQWGVFVIQQGTITIGASLYGEFPAPAPDEPGGELDFSDPANSGHVPGL